MFFITLLVSIQDPPVPLPFSSTDSYSSVSSSGSTDTINSSQASSLISHRPPFLSRAL